MKLYFYFFPLFLCSGIVNAQSQGKCGTDEYEKFRILQDPEIQNEKQKMETEVLEFQKIGALNSLRLSSVIEEPLRIPVIFHFIDPPSGYDFITKINEQIEALNECFRKKSNTPGYGTGEDSKIEFCPATKDGSGFDISVPYNIHSTGDPKKENWDSKDDDAYLKGLIHWDPNKFLNIYIVNKIDESQTDAYSSMPWEMNNPNLDGIVIEYVFFGKSPLAIRNQGKNLVHEVGHWLGLYHVFQNGKNSDENDCKNDDPDDNGDLITDTPPCTLSVADIKGGANNNPPPFSSLVCSILISRNTCTETDPDPNDNILIEDKNDPVDNYMHYSRDECRNAFTWLQGGRMQYFLTTKRKSIIKDNPAACPNHCINGIADEDETGTDCGGVSCDPCPTIPTGGGIITCNLIKREPPLFGDCFLRRRHINIFGCLEGDLSGETRNLYAFNYIIGTDGFHYKGGRLRVVADNWDCENSEVKAGTITLTQGFKFISEPSKPQNSIEFLMANLFPQSNQNQCEEKTDEPCPITHNIRKSRPISSVYDEETNPAKSILTNNPSHQIQLSQSENQIYVFIEYDETGEDNLTGNLNIELYSILGRKILLQTAHHRHTNGGILFTFSGESLKKGIYLARINLDGKVYGKKVVVF